jgi:release factor glutamine methyltransferase
MKHQPSILVATIAQKLQKIYAQPAEQQQAAWWLLEKLTNLDQAHLLVSKEIELDSSQEEQLAQWINAHVNKNEPLQYILGSVPFASLDILIKPPILIPRPETEEWCINLCNQFEKLKNKSLHILDLCTGSGCIALLLAKHFEKSQIVATDISDLALACARENAEHNKINNVRFLKSDLFESLDPSLFQYDLIVSNPPYIGSKEWKTLEPMVTEWEDRGALFSEHNGLAHIEKIIAKAPLFIRQNQDMQWLQLPQIVIEIGYRQGNQVKQLMRDALFEHVEIIKDLEGKDRIACGRMP